MRKLSNTKKFIYLISPKSIVNSKEFFKDLELVLKSKKVFFFQLRLKKENKKKIIFLVFKTNSKFFKNFLILLIELGDIRYINFLLLLSFFNLLSPFS